MFLVPSFSEKGVQYLVDMNTGFCQCKIGVNGSPCKHQYVLWVNKLSIATNFLPVFSKEQRNMYAEIAIGATFPLHLYEGLHDQVLSLPASDAPEQIDDREAPEVTFTSQGRKNVTLWCVACTWLVIGKFTLCRRQVYCILYTKFPLLRPSGGLIEGRGKLRVRLIGYVKNIKLHNTFLYCYCSSSPIWRVGARE